MLDTRGRLAQELKDELCREVVSTSKPIKEVVHAYALDLTNGFDGVTSERIGYSSWSR